MKEKNSFYYMKTVRRVTIYGGLVFVEKVDFETAGVKRKGMTDSHSMKM